jgi:hypothetical protein
LAAICAAVLLAFAGTASASQATSTVASKSAWPDWYSLVTFPSGHTYKVIKSGPIFGKGGKRLGMGISYLTSVRDLEQLRAAAAELFEYIRPVAEEQHDDAVMVLAQLRYVRQGPTFDYVQYGIGFKRDPSGAWHPFSTDESKPVPDVAPAPDDGISPDSTAEALAKADAEAWLAVMDADDFDASWAASSPSLNRATTRENWAKTMTGIRATFGKPLGRVHSATSASAKIPDAPSGKYVVVEFRSRFSKRPVVWEEVVEMMCDDGKWRVAGYNLR